MKTEIKMKTLKSYQNPCSVWLDNHNAHIISFIDGKEKRKTLVSGVEDFHPRGGSRSKVPYGPMDKVSESTVLERKKHQLALFFEEIKKKLIQADVILIMGPGMAKVHLEKSIESDNKFKGIPLETITLDSLTINQIAETARNHFEI
jgi:hypothetical protein